MVDNDNYRLGRAILEAMAMAEALHRGDRFGETEEYVSELGFMILQRMRTIREICEITDDDEGKSIA